MCTCLDTTLYLKALWWTQKALGDTLMHINPSRGIDRGIYDSKLFIDSIDRWDARITRHFADQVESEHRYLGSRHRPFQLIHASQLCTWLQPVLRNKTYDSYVRMSLALGLMANGSLACMLLFLPRISIVPFVRLRLWMRALLGWTALGWRMLRKMDFVGSRWVGTAGRGFYIVLMVFLRLRVSWSRQHVHDRRLV